MFAINLFGDFFSDMVVHMVIDKVEAKAAEFPHHEFHNDILFPSEDLHNVK